MKSSIFSLPLVIVLALSMTSCTHRKQQSADISTISVTIPPLEGVVKEIVGDDFEVKTILPAGSVPENFTPTPRQIAELKNSALFIYIGTLSFEQELSQYAHNKAVRTSDGIELLGGACGHFHHAEHDDEHAHAHTHAYDPHVWLSPFELETIVDNIAVKLSELYPDSVKYADNAHKIKALLRKKQSEYAQRLAKAPQSFLIYHPSLGYLAEHYDLKQIAVESEGKSPSVSSIAKIVEQIERGQVSKQLLCQKEYPNDVVKPIAEMLGVNIVNINPLSSDILTELDYIIDILSESYEQ